jgi:hypothetical protein
MAVLQQNNPLNFQNVNYSNQSIVGQCWMAILNNILNLIQRTPRWNVRVSTASTQKIGNIVLPLRSSSLKRVKTITRVWTQYNFLLSQGKSDEISELIPLAVSLQYSKCFYFPVLIFSYYFGRQFPPIFVDSRMRLTFGNSNNVASITVYRIMLEQPVGLGWTGLLFHSTSAFAWCEPTSIRVDYGCCIERSALVG